MLSEKTNKLLEKIAQQDATGMSQYKQRKVESERGHAGTGTALGSVLGAGAGALSGKYKPLTTAAGALLGAFTGRELGKRTTSKTKSMTQEGVVKKQQKTRADNATPQVPTIQDKAVLKLLRSGK